jgi:hypothetical protein
MSSPSFEWNDLKGIENQQKHGVSFLKAQFAFLDENVLLLKISSTVEMKNATICFGLNEQGNGIPTVRFTHRSGRTRIFGAGYWRKGKKTYEQINSI